MHSDLSFRFPRSLLSCTVVEAIFIVFDVFYIWMGIITAVNSFLEYQSIGKKYHYRMLIEFLGNIKNIYNNEMTFLYRHKFDALKETQ